MAQSLGNDPTLAPNGIEAAGDIGDETIGADRTTFYTISLKNNSSSDVSDVRIFANVVSGSVTLSPPHVHLTRLRSGETEKATFIVWNHTTTMQDNFTISQEIHYGPFSYAYDNFELPS